MNCSEVKLYSSETALGIAAPAKRDALEQHLTECASCAAAYTATQAVAQHLTTQLRSEGTEPAPRADVDAILEIARRVVTPGTGLRPDSSPEGKRVVTPGTSLRPDSSPEGKRVVTPGTGLRPDSSPSSPPRDPASPVSRPPKGVTTGQRSQVLRWIPLAAAVFFAAIGVTGAVIATAQTRRFEEQMQQFSGVLLEEARSEARKALFPALEQLDSALDERDVKQQAQLQQLAEWIQETRREDRAGFSDVLTDTREGLKLTQFALQRVAEQVPLVR